MEKRYAPRSVPTPRKANPDLPCLRGQRESRNVPAVGRSRVTQSRRVKCSGHTAGQPDVPCGQSREPQRVEGASSNTPPTASCLSPTRRTREIPGRMPTTVEVGRREPYESRMPAWEVRGGIVVGVRESRAHQEEDGWRRPPAFGNEPEQRYSANAQAVHRECTVEAEEMGRKAPNVCEVMDQRGRAGCGESRQSGSAEGMRKRTVDGANA